MAKKSNTMASVLAYEKKLVPSDGYMYGTLWEKRKERGERAPLKLVEKSVRGTISNRLKGAVKNDPMKLNAEVQKPNLQTVDSCALAENHDTLHLHFTLKVLGGLQEPSACNSPEFLKKYQEALADYKANENFAELGLRYALNLANARFLWRNRVGAEKIEVVVKDLIGGKTWTFDAKKFSIRDMQTNDETVRELGSAIAEALASEEDFLMLDVECFAKVGLSQEVYPSEELVLDKGTGQKSKILYEVDGIAAMHSQKLGNALRTIDTWYPDYSTEKRVIAIEPYGAVTNMGRAFRNPKNKKDFYTLFERFVEDPQSLEQDERDYVVAVLVRGGVFGESDKE
jgi:CRISPR-associated protein Csy3